jgi:hypothetical protein
MSAGFKNIIIGLLKNLHEISVLKSSIEKEVSVRAIADSKICFLINMETEGVFKENEYPFGFGFGSLSEPGFGAFVPFESSLINFSITGYLKSDTSYNLKVTFTLEHHHDSIISTIGEIEYVFEHGITEPVYNSQYIQQSDKINIYKSGNFCVKVSNILINDRTDNQFDPNTKFRCNLYLQRKLTEDLN